MKRFIKKLIGTSNIYYLKSLIKTKSEKEALEKRMSFYSQFLKKDDLYFDVGANLGNRIEPVLKIGAKIVAIEPQQQCYEYLEKRYGSKIQIIKKGLGEEEGVKEFYISNAHTISSFSADWIESVKKSGRFGKYKWDTKQLIEMTTLDKIIEKYGKPKFIKIDVEGYEFEVLKGLSKPINCISFEYAVPEQIEQSINCIEQINKIAGNVECNYSRGESMEWANEKWLSADEMVNFIRTGKLKGFGDIYVKLVSTAYDGAAKV